MNQARFWLTIAGILGAAGVGLGAYGAHGLEQRVVAVVAGSGVSASDELPAEQRKEIAGSVLRVCCRRFRRSANPPRFPGSLFQGNRL